MGFCIGERVKIWSVDRKENHSICSISSTREDTGRMRNIVTKTAPNGKTYYVDFSSKFVKFVGDAHNKRPAQGQSVIIKRCDVCQTPYYNAAGTVVYPNYNFVVYDYDVVGDSVVDREKAQYANSRPQFEAPTKYFEETVFDEDVGLPF